MALALQNHVELQDMNDSNSILFVTFITQSHYIVTSQTIQ